MTQETEKVALANAAWRAAEVAIGFLLLLGAGGALGASGLDAFLFAGYALGALGFLIPWDELRARRAEEGDRRVRDDR